MKNKHKNYNKETEVKENTTAVKSDFFDLKESTEKTAVSLSVADSKEVATSLVNAPSLLEDAPTSSVVLSMVNVNFANPGYIDGNRLECKASGYTNLKAYQAAKYIDLGFTIRLPKNYRAVLVLHESLIDTPLRLVGGVTYINPSIDESAVPATVLMEVVPKIHEVKMFNGAVRQDTHERTTYEIKKDDVVCDMYFEKIDMPDVVVNSAPVEEE